MSDLLAVFPVVVPIPVHWGEQDALGHVNNINYLRWCETARVYYLEKIGLWQSIAQDAVGPILASIACNFRVPVTFPDTVRVGARVTRIGNSSFRMEHRIVSEKLGLVADADSTLVIFDYRANRSCPIPPKIRGAIEELETHLPRRPVS